MSSSSELFALSQQQRLEGKFACHWCAGACDNTWVHDDPPPVPFVRSTSGAKNPQGVYVCKACKSFRQTRLTLWTLGGKFKDRESPRANSWFITESAARIIDLEADAAKLYELLLSPPEHFCLALRESGDNHLHLWHTNRVKRIKPETALVFTLNNIKHFYSVRELRLALKGESQGFEPGVSAILRLLGRYTPVEVEKAA